MDTHVANENKKDEDKKIISFLKLFKGYFFIFMREKKRFSHHLASIFDETNTTHFQFNLQHTSRCHTEMYSFIE